jgi:acetoin utilization deacetylase AcuC-like enzyme
MKIITDENCLAYERPGHPERPARISMTLEKLRRQNEMTIAWAKPEAVSDEQLLRAHSKHHLHRLTEPHDFDADTPWFANIVDRARASAGASLAAMKAARAGETAFSLMRPPGHHATKTQAMGFCYLSNIAIAALEARATGVRRVAIYDFDVHHGNGTEDVLLNQPGTAFFSIHQFPCYPGTGATNVGDNCFNFPVAPNTPRVEYRKVLASALDQLKKFEPELIGVSAGFDAYARDPLAQETLEAEDYNWLGRQLRAIGVPLFSILEGGYSDDLGDLVFAYLRAIEGK